MRWLGWLLGGLLWLAGWSQPSLEEALARAESLLTQAQRAQGSQRQRLIEGARRAISPLPAPAREPLERRLDSARWSQRAGALREARRALESYRATLRSDARSPDPSTVRAQLDAIFAEPDMQPPPKSLIERIGEAIFRFIEQIGRWLARLLRGLPAGTGGAWGAIVQWVIVALLILIIAFGASYLIGRLEWRRERRALPALDEELIDARLLASTEWHALAQQLRAQGDLRAAARALYLGILRLLHEAHLLDYEPSRTNWEHLMRLRSPALPAPATREQAYQLLQPLTVRFDYLWYGKEPASESDFGQFESVFETLNRVVRADAQRVA